MQVALIVLVLATSAVLTGVVRRVALSHNLVDVPNARSSHNRTTARGGGIAVVLAAIGGLSLLRAVGVVSWDFFLAVGVGGIAVALIGLLDDLYMVRPGLRILVHAGAALWVLYWFGGPPPLLFGEHLVPLGRIGYVIGALGIVWVLNLFNFMDGVDGIAATEAVFVSSAGAVLGLIGVNAGQVTASALVLASATAGFLLWNRPPAKVFLGDVGSGFLGYMIAAFALAAARTNPVALWIWLILIGAFFVDATVTLLRRLVRGERVYQAHRSHAYQWLARRWASHGRVTVAVLLADVFWLLPCAVLATLYPSLAAVTTLVALAPLLAIAIAAGSGRPEQRDRAMP